METEKNPKDVAKSLGIEDGNLDFTLEEKELKDVAGGRNSLCGEIGVQNPDCTKTGYGASCGEIGFSGTDSTKLG